MKKMILIVGAGSMAPENEIKKILIHEPIVIAVDGGMLHLKSISCRPHMIIGDLDSIPAELLKEAETAGIAIHRFSPKKDKSDMELALEEALSMNPSEIIITGALGGRTDHSLFNLQLLLSTADRGIPVRIMGPEEEIFPVTGPVKIKLSLKTGTLVSLLPPEGPAENVTLTGFLYPLNNETLTPGSSRSLSNETSEDRQTISLGRGKIMVIVNYSKL